MTKRPNLLLITTDQHRWDCVGCNGNGEVRTPHLDRLAAEGVNFRNAYTPNPVCAPARAAITTGLKPHRATTGEGNECAIRPGVITMPAFLRRHGYRTAAFGKLHYLPYAQPRTLHGFEHAELCEEGRILWDEIRTGRDLGGEDYHRYLETVGYGGYQRAHGIGNNDIHTAPSPLPAEHYVDAWVRRRTLDWLGNHVDEGHDAPFFVWTSFVRPHSPFDPPEPYHRLYDPRTLSPPRGAPELLRDKNPLLATRRKAYAWDVMASPQMIQSVRAHYYGLVTFIDEQIGLLLDFLDERSLARDTIVLFTTDHGEMLGDFGLFFKNNLLEPAVHVPFIVRGGGRFVGGLSHDGLVGLEDVFPTFASLAGLPITSPLDGMALDRLLTGDAPPRASYISHAYGKAHSYMLRRGPWKYIYNEYGGVEELYDLKHDPHELENAARRPKGAPSIQVELRRELINLLKAGDDRRLLQGDHLTMKTEPPLDTLTETVEKTQGWRWY